MCWKGRLHFNNMILSGLLYPKSNGHIQKCEKLGTFVVAALESIRGLSKAHTLIVESLTSKAELLEELNQERPPLSSRGCKIKAPFPAGVR